MARNRGVDFAVLCPIPEEWESACRKLESPWIPPNQKVPTKLGLIAGSRVVCVMSGKGEGATATCLQSVLSTWRPRWVLLVGIAGGFPDQGVHRGDVVVARYIYNFDFGKLASGKFLHRPDYDFGADRSLLTHAELVMKAEGNPWKLLITTSRPDGQEKYLTTVHDGYIASSSKVVDDPDHEFFDKVKRAIPVVHAVEMEASGAGAAIALEKSRRAVGFLMVRGISDEPVHHAGPTTGTRQREKWKLYASDVASSFARQLIAEVSGSSRRSGTKGEEGSAAALEPASPERICQGLHAALRRLVKNRKGSGEQVIMPSVAILHGEHFPNSYLRPLLHLLDEASIKWQCPSLERQTYSYARSISNVIESCTHILFLARSAKELTCGWAAYASSMSLEKEREWMTRIVKL